MGEIIDGQTRRAGPGTASPFEKGKTMYEEENNPSQGGAQHPDVFDVTEQPTSPLAEGEANRSTTTASTSSPPPAAAHADHEKAQPRANDKP